MPSRNKRAKLGYKIGGRKIDCKDYTPKSGKFSDYTVVRHEWKDGWKIVESMTFYDITLMASLTGTCINGQPFLDARFCVPNPEIEEQEILARAKSQASSTFDTPYYRKHWDSCKGKVITKPGYYGDYGAMFKGCKTFEDWISQKEADCLKNLRNRGRSNGNGKIEPFYRFMHVEDDKGRLHACILMGAATIAGDTKKNGNWAYNYGQARDLGQEHTIEIDGEPFHVLECRLGTGRTAPECALERVIEWYAETTGKWDQKAFEAVQAHSYGAVSVKAPKAEFRPK